MVSIQSFKLMALFFPGTVELPHFKKTSFRVKKKMFATLSAKTSIACVLLSEVDQSVFCKIDAEIIYPVPNKWGLKGATYVNLKKINKDLLSDILQTAHKQKLKPKEKI